MEIVWVNARVGSNPTPSAEMRWDDSVGWHSHPRPLTRLAWVLLRWSLTAPSSETSGSESHPVRCDEVGPHGSGVGLGAWLSPVERCVRVAEVPGSNPGAPIEEEVVVPVYPAPAGVR